ncbi:MAG: RNA polymerase factor sigma-54 [Lysinibacillus sp.]
MILHLQHIQKQQFHLTTEMKHSLHILQLPIIDLMDYIQEKSTENPCIQLDYNRFSNNHITTRKHSAFDNLMERLPSPEPFNLSQLLLEQMPINLLSEPTISKACKTLISHIDERGYLPVSLEDISFHSGLCMNKLERALSIIQSLEPAGIGARNLKECLLLQLGRNFDMHQTPYHLVEECFDEMINQDQNAILKKFKIDSTELDHALDVIKNLHINPLAPFSDMENAYIIPDITIEKRGKQLHIKVNNELLPAIVINTEYYEMLSHSNEDTEIFLREHMKEAYHIIKSIKQRNRTLLKLVQKLIELQLPFFLEGPKALKPMGLKEMVAHMGIHESTISRAVNGKYIQTPFGLFRLHQLFAKGLDNAKGGKMTIEQIKSTIQALVKEEDKFSPYSDQELCHLLTKEGIQISRRTIAKYREELNIPSSVKRSRKPSKR